MGPRPRGEKRIRKVMVWLYEGDKIYATVVLSEGDVDNVLDYVVPKGKRAKVEVTIEEEEAYAR